MKSMKTQENMQALHTDPGTGNDPIALRGTNHATRWVTSLKDTILAQRSPSVDIFPSSDKHRCAHI